MLVKNKVVKPAFLLYDGKWVNTVGLLNQVDFKYPGARVKDS